MNGDEGRFEITVTREGLEEDGHMMVEESPKRGLRHMRDLSKDSLDYTYYINDTTERLQERMNARLRSLMARKNEAIETLDNATLLEMMNLILH
jgi:hypothetical protein